MCRSSFRRTAILFAWMLLPSSLHAQGRPATGPSAEASGHFERGTTFYGEGDYAAALVEFKRAYELEPTWQVLFNVGQAYFQLRDYANALLTLRRFASEGGDRISKEDRGTLDTELPDLEGRVARVTIESNVVGASVQVDDQPVGKTPLHEPVLVSIGMRKIVAAVDGRAPVERSIAVGSGDAVTIRLDFAASAPPAALAPVKTSTGQRASETPSHVPAYVTLGLGGAGVATGGTFGVLAMLDKSRLDRACSASRACPTSSQTNLDALQRDSLVSTIAFGAGAALLAAGVTLWLLERPEGPSEPAASASPRTEPARASLHIGPAFLAGTF
jgi:hypothetical protein